MTTALPWTPDFDCYSTQPGLAGAEVDGAAVRAHWCDGRVSRHHALWLRENSPDPETIHPLSREMLMSPLSIPAALHPSAVEVEASGALRVTWSHGGDISRYHPGWLRAHAWFEGDEAAAPTPLLWDAAALAAPPTFDGPRACAEDVLCLDWLEAIQVHGIARLEGLPDEADLLERVVARIGPLRETNFGRTYRLFIKDEPNSNAFTADALLQHMDLPTRECPHGLQFLHCLENSVTGGEGIYVDGYRVAENLRAEAPDWFEALTTIEWEFNNRAKDSDYRAKGPVIALDATGRISGIRLTPWLRAPLKAPLDVQERAYLSVRTFMSHCQDPAYQLVFGYRPDDLVAFDNRRVLHGRRAYDERSGTRHIVGAFADRDDLNSRVRTLKRKAKAPEPIS